MEIRSSCSTELTPVKLLPGVYVRDSLANKVLLFLRHLFDSMGMFLVLLYVAVPFVGKACLHPLFSAHKNAEQLPKTLKRKRHSNI